MNVFWLQKTEADVPTEDGWLCANEALRLSHMPFAKRRADWRLGRWTAKCAVAACMGRSIETAFLSEIEIRQALSGVPEVFLAGQPAALAISLSHRAGVAMAAVVPSAIALGCDLEIIEPRTGTFIADYFTHEEQVLVACTPMLDRPALVALLWSAKESALKALQQGLRLDTRSVLVNRVGLERSPNQWSPLQVLYTSHSRTFYGWWQRADNLVRTLVAGSPLFPPISLASGPTEQSERIYSCAGSLTGC